MNADEIRKWHSIFKRPDELFEIRIIGDRNPLSGYFYDVEQAIEALKPYDNLNIYYTINEVKNACASRSQFGQFQMVKGSATSKQDIEHRWILPIDLDCERPSGVSSTEEEKSLAKDRAGEVYYFLKSNGFSEPIICDSSSGYHVMYPIDMGNTEEAELAVKAFLEILAHRFTDEKVKIDTVLHDANRILRLPGSWGRKGRSTKDRPHREAKILYVPQEIRRMGIGEIQAFNEKFKIVVEQPQRVWNEHSNEAFDIRKFISEHGIKVSKEVSIPGGGTKFVLEECPFDSGHKAPDSAIFELPNGAIAFKCYHNSCQGHDWHELRERLDPTAYQSKQSRQQPRYYQPLPQAIQPVIKQETPELGKKWFGMKDIQKVNINELPHFLTGFKELDKAIKGLFFSEVTILSGSNSSGKSSWLNTLILNAVQQGVKTALWSGELRRDVLKTWIQMVAAGKETLGKSAHGNYWYVPNHIGEKIDEWLEGMFYLYNNSYSNKISQIKNDMKELLSMGVRFFVLDNLMSMSLDLFDGDSNKQQKGLISELCDFAKNEQVHILLVAHPRKVSTFIRKTDISGSSDLTNAVDNVLICHRVNNDFKKLGGEYLGRSYIDRFINYSNVIEVAKNRMMGAQDVLCGMYYENESRRFKNSLDEVMYYGWRTDIQANTVQEDLFKENDGPVPF